MPSRVGHECLPGSARRNHPSLAAPAGVASARMDAPVCFHGKDRCWFCWLAGRPPAIVVPDATCRACGGRIDSPGAECPRCVLIEAEAMMLPIG